MWRHTFEGLTDEQVGAIVARGRVLFHWFKEHPRIHNTMNLALSSSSSSPTIWP